MQQPVRGTDLVPGNGSPSCQKTSLCLTLAWNNLQNGSWKSLKRACASWEGFVEAANEGLEDIGKCF